MTAQLEELARQVWHGKDLPQRGQGETAADLRRRLGSELFEAILGGRVGILFYESLARKGRTEGLRIKLRFDLADPQVARLATLPWEYLYSDRRGVYLALQRSSPVVRYIEVSQPTELGALPFRLRILVAVASPTDVPALDVTAERQKLERALADREDLEIAFLEQSGRESLAATLRDAVQEGRPFHGLHFIGHGAMDTSSGRGVLFLVTADGAARAVSGEELAYELADYPELRLVFLNACETGKVAVAPAAHPFDGVATALVRTGVLAVVAMQQPISDPAAIEFSRVIYERIAAGDAIDTAVTEGRLALDRQPETAQEWGIPVLFLRQPDGRLFEPRKPEPRPRWKSLAAVLVPILVLAVVVFGVLNARFGSSADPCRQETSDEVRRLTREGARLADEGHYAAAAESLHSALGADPHFAHAWSILGLVALEQGKESARESFARAAQEQPGCPNHQYNLGSFHLSREEFGEARQHLRRALELDPDYTLASAALGRAYFLHGGLDAAREVLEEALERTGRAGSAGNDGETAQPQDALFALHANLGRVSLAQERPAKAVGHLQTALEFLPGADPRRADIISDLAAAHAAAGQPSDACHVLSGLLPLGRDPVMPWERRAVELGDTLSCNFETLNSKEISP